MHSLMEAQFPNGILTHIMGAELAMDEGDLDKAHAYLALIPEGKNLWRYTAANARLAYLNQNYQTAYDISYRLGRSRQPSMGVSIRLESARMSNDALEAIHVLGRNTWDGHEAPEFLLSNMMSLADLGEYSEANEIGEYLMALYSENHTYLAEAQNIMTQIEGLQSESSKHSQ